MPTHTGLGVAWGITVGSFKYKVVGSGTADPKNLKAISQTISKEAQSDPHYDPLTGDVVGYTFYQKSTKIDIEVFAYCAVGAHLSELHDNNLLPEPGSIVYLISGSSSDADSDSGSSGTAYVCMSASKSKGYTGKNTIKLTLERPAGMAAVAADAAFAHAT